MRIKVSDLNAIRMSTNPPQELVNSEYRVIHKDQVKQWVGIGWVTERPATTEDYNNIPEVIDKITQLKKRQPCEE